MDVDICIQQRRSIRAFTEVVPPRATILECLQAASWAPNPTSQQPWKFIVLTGDCLHRICSVIQEHFQEASQEKSRHETDGLREDTSRMLNQKKEQVFREMVSHLTRHGADLKKAGEGNFNFHGAPAGVIFATYRGKDLNYFKATIAAMQNFMLAAEARGLGTCWINAVSICESYIRRELDLPSDIVLVDGVALGYPESSSPLNTIPRDRYPVEQVTLWP